MRFEMQMNSIPHRWVGTRMYLRGTHARLLLKLQKSVSGKYASLAYYNLLFSFESFWRLFKCFNAYGFPFERLCFFYKT